MFFADVMNDREMNHQVTSRFSITSKRFRSELLSTYFPWKVIERDKFVGQTKPKEKTDIHVTAYDLGLGADDRLRVQLEKATDELMKYLQKLEDLQSECEYTLWVKYNFPSGEGSGEIPATLSSRLAHLRVNLMIEMTTSKQE